VRGSHHFLQDSTGHSTVVPVHSGEAIGPGLPKKSLADCELTTEELIRLL